MYNTGTGEVVQILLPNGETATASIDFLDFLFNYYVSQGISMGVQIGSTAIMLLLILLLTRPDKRKTPIFICNAAALTLSCVRGIMYCVFLTGPFLGMYPNITDDYSKIPAWAKHVSVSVDTLTLTIIIAILASLILQVRVVCTDVTMPMWFRRSSIVAVSIASLIAVGVRFSVTVLNGISIVNARTPSKHLSKLADISSSCVTAAVCVACCFLLYKLWAAIVNQKRFQLSSGLSPMQIVFIVCCQTMIVPAVIAIIQFVPSVWNGIGLQVTCVISVSLPLSSLWATAVTNHRNWEMDKNRFQYNSSFVGGGDTSPTSPKDSEPHQESKAVFMDGFGGASIFDRKIPHPPVPVLKPVISPCVSEDSDLSYAGAEKRQP